MKKLKTLEEAKDEMAKEYDFPNWETLYNSSTKEQIELYMGMIVCKQVSDALKLSSFSF